MNMRLDALLLAILGLAWSVSRFAGLLLGRIEEAATHFSRQRNRVLIVVALTAILFRLALLPVMPVPVPDTHDEFAHLLAADTFAHGKLANPPHPMWIYFDTFHELMHPSYASIFAPANGAFLAIGDLLGHPWLGVLISMTSMCVAITWALQSWLPPQWALLGTIFVLFRIYLFSYWLESYWGGAVPAIGGALVIGSVAHIMRRKRPLYAVVMGLGASLLATSRPFEGFLFCVPVAVALVVSMFSQKSPEWRLFANRIVLPFLSVLVPTLVFLAYYDWRVTGHMFVMPEALYARQYINYRIFIWQKLKPPLTYANPQFEQYFNVFLRQSSHGWGPLWQIHSFWQFFLGPTLSLPLVMVPWLFRDRRMRLLLIQFLLCALGFLSVAVGFMPHYGGPVTATFCILFVQAMRHLRRVEIWKRPIGIFLTRLVVILMMLRAASYIHHPPSMQEPWARQRATLAKQLQSTTEQHLVIVRYSEEHSPHDEWVYNAADIDHSKVVWAREIPGVDLKPLLDYFHDRTVWEVEPDSPRIELHAYRGTP